MPDQFATMLTAIAKAAEEASPMRPSSLIRRRGDQRRAHHRAAVGVLAAVAVGAIVATGSVLGIHRTANVSPATPPSNSTGPTPTTATPNAPDTASPSANPTGTSPRTTNTAPLSSSATQATACPATAAQLMPALQASEADYARAIQGAAKPLVLVVDGCYGNYASAHSEPDPTTQQQTAHGVFKFDPATRTWKVLHYAGSGGWCQNYVPADVMRNLGGC